MIDETFINPQECKKCGKILPGTNEFFHFYKKNGEKKLRNVCKPCYINQYIKGNRNGFCANCGVRFYGSILNAKPSPENPKLCTDCYKNTID